MSTNTQPRDAQQANQQPAQSPDEALVRTTPTTLPVLVRLALVLVGGGVVIGILFLNPRLLGSRANTDIALLLAQALVFIAVVRLVVDYYVLRRTKYTITTSAVKREYELLFRRESREVPFGRVRSHEFDQSRIENLLGYGSISLNKGLGSIELVNVDNPDDVYRTLREQVRRH